MNSNWRGHQDKPQSNRAIKLYIERLQQEYLRRKRRLQYYSDSEAQLRQREQELLCMLEQEDDQYERQHCFHNLSITRQQLQQVVLKVAEQRVKLRALERRINWLSRQLQIRFSSIKGNFVPSYKLPNPQRSLRDRPRNDFKMTVLPKAWVLLSLQVLLGIGSGNGLFALCAFVTLTLLWLLPAIFEQLRR